MVLTLLAVLVAALIGLAIASRAATPRVVSLGTAGISALVVLLTLGSLASRAEATVLALPVGPPSGALRLALDPLGAAFLLLLFVPAIACAAFAGVPPMLQSGSASAPLVGIGSGVGIYLLLRMLLDLSGPPISSSGTPVHSDCGGPDRSSSMRSSR